MRIEDGGVLRVDNKFSLVNFVSQYLLPLILLGSFVGCAGPMSEPLQQPFSPAKHRSIRFQSCVDQSAERGNWNLAAEATQTLRETVLRSGRFEIAPEPALVFSCNVEGVVDRRGF